MDPNFPVVEWEGSHDPDFIDSLQFTKAVATADARQS